MTKWHLIVVATALLGAATGCGSSKSSDASGGSGGAAGGAGGNTGGKGGGGAGGNTGGGGGAGGAGGASGGGGAGGAGGASGGGGGGGAASALGFFVTSSGSVTGNLGGLAGADKKCQDLAAAVGAGGRAWRAYLSTSGGPGGAPIHAKDRIGKGPWRNAKGAVVANDVADLHTKKGDYMVFLDEKGNPVPGQWMGSPKPVVHDILTGSNADGTLKTGSTCADWTSEDGNDTAWVGHSDGLGPGGSTSGTYSSWNSSHENGGCDDTAPRGGAGQIYCFAD